MVILLESFRSRADGLQKRLNYRKVCKIYFTTLAVIKKI